MKQMNAKNIEGSALILTVVLTSLLAIIGIMFVMAANMDRITTSSVPANKELQFAVDSVVAQISQRLIEDVPGVAGAEYYDYPGDRDQWLASLEPNKTGTVYRWPQISDATGYLAKSIPTVKTSWDTRNIPIIGPAAIIEDHKQIALDNNGNIAGIQGQAADADGDGVADSKWIELEAGNNQPAMTKSGKRIYAAIRIIDNGAMLNANTAYKFDPGGSQSEVDGSRLWQINLMALAARPPASYTTGEDDYLRKARAYYSSDWSDLAAYERDVSWRYYLPELAGKYTPFDISDELAMRNRFLLKRKNLLTQTDIHTRLENWGGEFMDAIWTPVNDSTAFGKWPKRVYDDGNISGGIDPNYAYRHIVTTYNFDRVLSPRGSSGMMVFVNDPNVHNLRDAIYNAFADIPDANAVMTDAEHNRIAGQLAANIKARVSNDANGFDFGGTKYYGFAPQPFISEIGIKIPADPCTTDSSFAIELYNPFNVDIPLGEFALEIPELPATYNPITLSGTMPANSYYIIANNTGIITGDQTSNDLVLAYNYVFHNVPPTPPYWTWTNVTYVLLVRQLPDGTKLYLDNQAITNNSMDSTLFQPTSDHYLERDKGHTNHPLHVVYPQLGNPPSSTHTFRTPSNYQLTGVPEWKFNWPPFGATNGFTTVGDISRMLRIGPSANPLDNTLGLQLMDASITTEDQIRVDLHNPDYRNIFQYLTVFDPNNDKINNDGDDWTDESELNRTPESKIPGRININTAPWYVIAQLPWVSNHSSNYELAKAIVAYRDKLNLSGGPDYSSRQTGTGINNVREDPGFESTGELNFVMGGPDNYRIDYYATVSAAGNLTNFPDLDDPSQRDNSDDDFEERDVIFSRISNLVTVRSDVFTAYILVRLGPDGPQKRVIAILDRSDVYPSGGRIKIVALWPVPDSR